jgi:hypothetical protein
VRPRRYRLRATVWLIRRIIAVLDAISRRHHIRATFTPL